MIDSRQPLTGADHRRASGRKYAGLFANDDKLAERLVKVGNETGEAGCGGLPLGPGIRQDDRFEVLPT